MVEENQNRMSFLKKAMFLFTVANLLICVAYIAVSIVLIDSQTKSCPTSMQSLFTGDSQISLASRKIFYDLSTKEFAITDVDSSKRLLSGFLGHHVDLDDYANISLHKRDEKSFHVEYEPKSRSARIALEVYPSKSSVKDSINCTSYKWSVKNGADERFANQEFEDCFHLGNYSWFGGAESFGQQFWPINEQDYLVHFPYLTGLFGKWSSILERYWLSQSGVAIIAQQDVPLFVLKNRTSICLKASSKEPYNKERIVSLTYDICVSDKTVASQQDYLNNLQLFVINNYFAKPSGIPDLLMMRYPIWSTWAQFKGNINVTNVKQYASDIVAYNFSHSQLEIDGTLYTLFGN